MSMRFSLFCLAFAGMALPAAAESLSFTLSNQSNADLTEFYASPVGTDSWEENILSTGALPAGASGDITIAEAKGCEYDFRMVFADGDVLEDRSNVCDSGAYTIQ
ncbi:hypothetical protein D2N39_06790 [Gemmobacter lutimaris]|uniref:Uncharacterized protein n=1 Tax=Gemmobacter lutimaris TaxID=2306023 RepID=A0A398BYH0_9RHOB|nr:hypothetical protein [Gemmobacter lutimaris]RID92353.1 hypothetical protein D2N39_06790 [Gemmobacter lutimaris]